MAGITKKEIEREIAGLDIAGLDANGLLTLANGLYETAMHVMERHDLLVLAEAIQFAEIPVANQPRRSPRLLAKANQ